MNKKTQILKKIISVVLILGISSFIFSPLARAATSYYQDTPNENPWVINNSINSIAANGDTVYIGGAFTYVGLNTGKGVPVNASSGIPVAVYPKVNGAVNTVISDGDGGWYIGGGFTQVGGVERNKIAHILSNGSVDSGWNPNANNYVDALVLDSDNSILYVGGGFTSIGSQNRNLIAAIDTTTGNATDWNPNATGEAYSSVSALALDSASSTLYVGGYFTSIGGQERNNLAALNTSTSTATDWDPNANGSVYTLALDSQNSLLYVGGSFTSIGGQSRNSIAAFNISTNTATDWNPDAGEYNEVNALALDSASSTLYVGGSFTSIGGQDRNNLAALNTSTSTATDWDPNADDVVDTLVLDSDNSILYVGGGFENIGGQPRLHIAAFDTLDGGITEWHPNTEKQVFALALNSDGTLLYVGGNFTSIGGQDRNYIAALDVTEGVVTDWNPNANDYVYTLALDSQNSLLYVGGSFTSIGGQNRQSIAALNTSTSTATDWNPNANNTVYTLALDSQNSLLYVGGSFTSIGGQNRNYIAALNTSTSTATDWDPNADDTVKTLALDSQNSLLYVGGDFTSIGGQNRQSIAALNTSTGTATDWNPSAEAWSYVYTLALDSASSTLYVGGSFTSIGGQERNNLAALNTSTSTATDWNPNVDNYVNTLVLDSIHDILYVGGGFTSIGGQNRNYIASLNTSTSTATDWDPDANEDVKVLALDLDRSMLYVGGEFTQIGGQSLSYFAQFDPITIQFTQSSSQGLENVTPVNLELSLSNTNTSDISVSYAVTDGTATKGEDYTLEDGIATISAGNTTTTIEIAIIDDDLDELDETIVVTLSNPQNAFLGTNTSHTYTILDDDESTTPPTTTPPTTTPPTTTPPVAPAAGGSGAQSQIQNLIEIGNYKYACQIINQWPGLLSQSEKERICQLAASEEKPISEMTLNELNAQIAVLRTRIAELQDQLAKLLGKQAIGSIGVYPEIPAGFKFERNLRLGMTGNDVKYLQIILNSDPDTRLALSGAGSPGNETNYFGPLTQAAVIKFQEKYASEILAPWNLTKGTGVVANATRAKLNQLLGF